MKKPSFDLWYFEWWDATSVDEWSDIYDLMQSESHTIRTVGFLLNEDEQSVCVAMNFDAEAETASCVMYIPRSIITKRHRIIIDGKLTNPNVKKAKISDPSEGGIQ